MSEPEEPDEDRGVRARVPRELAKEMRLCTVGLGEVRKSFVDVDDNVEHASRDGSRHMKEAFGRVVEYFRKAGRVCLFYRTPKHISLWP